MGFPSLAGTTEWFRKGTGSHLQCLLWPDCWWVAELGCEPSDLSDCQVFVVLLDPELCFKYPFPSLPIPRLWGYLQVLELIATVKGLHLLSALCYPKAVWKAAYYPLRGKRSSVITNWKYIDVCQPRSEQWCGRQFLSLYRDSPAFIGHTKCQVGHSNCVFYLTQQYHEVCTIIIIICHYPILQKRKLKLRRVSLPKFTQCVNGRVQIWIHFYLKDFYSYSFKRFLQLWNIA